MQLVVKKTTYNENNASIYHCHLKDERFHLMDSKKKKKPKYIDRFVLKTKRHVIEFPCASIFGLEFFRNSTCSTHVLQYIKFKLNCIRGSKQRRCCLAGKNLVYSTTRDKDVTMLSGLNLEF